MSNLTPTPQTDKNGVTGIRYMKADHPDTAVKKDLPPVKAPAGFPGYSDEQLADVFGIGVKDEPEYWETNLKVIQAMRESNPSIIKVALKLIDSGSEAGAVAVRARLAKAANSIRMYCLHPYSYPSVKSVLKYSWNADTKRELVRNWSQADVCADLDPALLTEPDYMYGSAIYTLHRHISGNGRYPLDTDYWRGVTLLHFSGAGVDNNGNFWGVENADAAASMAKWMSEHENPNLAVTVARDLRIYDPEVLGRIIAEGHHKSAVRDGFI